MTLILLTFLATTALWAAVLVLLAVKVARHCRENPAAIQALSEHLLAPLLARKEKPTDGS